MTLHQKVRWLLLPWLLVSGLAVPGGLVGGVLCVLCIPTIFKLASIPLILITVFLIFPTWFTAIHVFSSLSASAPYRVDRARRDHVYKYFYS